MTAVPAVARMKDVETEFCSKMNSVKTMGSAPLIRYVTLLLVPVAQFLRLRLHLHL